MDVRAERVSGREGKPVHLAKDEILRRERSERTRYKAIYDLDIEDTRGFDVVIDSADKTPDEIVALVWARVSG